MQGLSLAFQNAYECVDLGQNFNKIPETMSPKWEIAINTSKYRLNFSKLNGN